MAIKKAKRKKSRPINATNKHTTRKVIIQDAIHAEIDEEIIPLIQWFNSLPGVVTLYCCQGDESSEVPNAYVLFHCTSEISLFNILTQIEDFNKVAKNLGIRRSDITKVENAGRKQTEAFQKRLRRLFMNHIELDVSTYHIKQYGIRYSLKTSNQSILQFQQQIVGITKKKNESKMDN